MLRQWLKMVLLTLAWVGGFTHAEPPVFLDDKGRALDGYDPVAYFTEHKSVKGSEEYTATHDGGKYWFWSEKNRDAFKAEPGKYAPQYGGYCAYAASLGKKADGDPTQWAVINGKLYINYNGAIQKKWQADQAEYIKKADAKWDGLRNQ